MAKLLHTERVDDRVHRWYRHDDTKITVQTEQAVDPIFKQVERSKDMHRPKQAFRLKASIPSTVVEEVCRTTARTWGVSANDVFAELMQNKTGRAKKVWKMLSEARELNKFHTKTY